MTYLSIDELDCFAFHDAELTNIKFECGNMIWNLCAVNATTLNSQNNFPKDMCINEAEIIFESVKIIGIRFGAYKTYLNKVLIESVEAQDASPEEFDSILLETLGAYCYILSMEIMPTNNDCKYVVCFNIDGGAGNYDFTFGFTKSTVQWDEFSGEAWYEDEK